MVRGEFGCWGFWGGALLRVGEASPLAKCTLQVARLVVRNWVGGVLVWCIAARMAEHQFSTMYPTDTGHLQSQEDAKKVFFI